MVIYKQHVYANIFSGIYIEYPISKDFYRQIGNDNEIIRKFEFLVNCPVFLITHTHTHINRKLTSFSAN